MNKAKFNNLLIIIPFIIFTSCNDNMNEIHFKNFSSIIPEPSEINILEGFLQSDSIMPINVDDTFMDISFCTNMLTEFLNENTERNEQHKNISFNIIKSADLGIESYELCVNENGIQLFASTKKGVLYGLQTFFQVFLSEEKNRIPYMIIKDSPRFPHRGLMLDPARHFIPINDLKKFISLMSFYKFNHLHLHLADDEGWCVEIKGLTKLNGAGIGSPGMGSENRYIYTQAELKDLVAYAAEREVEIIPEIDIPGHSSYITSLFPDMMCGISAPRGQLCAGNDNVIDFMNIVIKEFAEIFPSENFHLGGDEFSIETIKSCEICQSKIRQHGFQNEEQLVSHMFENVAKIAEKHNKTPMFWHETNMSSYPRNSTLYSWRKGLFAKALSVSNSNECKLISSPEEYAYFNYPQMPKGEPPFDNWGMPAISLKHVYSFDPTFGHSPEQTKNLIGVEALLWNEYITSIDMLYYMIFPRALAFSEAGWSYPKNRNWKRFCKKLDFHLQYLSHKEINYRFPSEI